MLSKYNKGIYEAQIGLTLFDCGSQILVDQFLATWITNLMNSPNSQVILKYHQVYLNSQPSTIPNNH